MAWPLPRPRLPAVKLHDQLVARAVLGALVPVWLILLGFDAVQAFVGEVDEFGQGDYGAGTALLYTLHTLPRRAYELFPTVAVIAALLGLGALASTSELTALRAAGLSRAKTVRGALILIAALTLAMVVIGETVAPAGEQRAQALSLAAKSRDLAVAGQSGIWAREGDLVLNARRSAIRQEGPLTLVELRDLRLYAFEPDGRLQSFATAERAVHRDGAWQLEQVRRTRFGAHSVSTTEIASERWESELDPQLLRLSAARPRYLASRDLAESIAYLRRNDLDASEFEIAYWARYFYPVNVLVLCLAAMPFAFANLRSGGFGKRLFLGIVFGVGFFLLQRLAMNMAQVYGIDLRVATALPVVVIAATSWLWFRRGV